MRVPKNLDDLVSKHVVHDKWLKEYLLTALGRKADPTGGVLEELKHRSAMSLVATNKWVRHEFARAAFKRLEACVERFPKRKAYFVTFSPKDFAVPFEQASSFDTARIIDWAKEVLAGLSYIAVVEVALYTTGPALAHSRYGWISFHVHAVVSGGGEERLAKLIADVNANNDPIIPGPTAADYMILGRQSIARRSLYMLKLPMEAYRAYDMKTEGNDPETGEVLPVSTGVMRQRKRPLRPAEAVRCNQVLKGRTMPSLLFAGGWGKSHLTKIIKRATKALEEDQRLCQKDLEAIYRQAGLVLEGSRTAR